MRVARSPVRPIEERYEWRRDRARRRRRVVGPVLVVCALLAVLVALDYWSNAGGIYRGVEVGGVDLGGKSQAEAREVVETEIGGSIAEMRLVGPESVTVSNEALGVHLDAEATVEEAYAVGRDRNILIRLKDRLAAAWGMATLEPEVSYDLEVARMEMEKLASGLNAEPREGTVNISGGAVEVGESREGYEMNVEATLANVDQAIKGLTGEAEIVGRPLEPGVTTAEAEQAAAKAEAAMAGPVTLSAGDREWTLSPAAIGRTLSVAPEEGRLAVSLDEGRLRESLADVYKRVNAEPVEAGFVPQGAGVVVTESRAGTTVDEGKLFADLGAGLFEGGREYGVPITTAEPKMTTAEAEALKPTQLLGSYRTNYTLSSDKSAERVENLRIASGAVSGRLVAPGEVFSFNELAAPLKYNKTHVIIEGQETFADGGGLCQVASTLFMAANYAGLEIVERHPHFSELPYIRPGLDATVWFGSLDMKFRNTTDGYLLVQESVGDDGYVYASIYGRPTGTQVVMNSKPTFRGENASEWVTYKKVKEDGKVVFNGPMFTTSYDALIDEHGRKVPPTELTPAPVIP